MAKSLTDFLPGIKPEVLGCPDPVIEGKALDILADFCRRSGIWNVGFETAILSSAIDTAKNNAVEVTMPTEMANWQPCQILVCRVDDDPFFAVERYIPANVTDIADNLVPDDTYLWYLSATNKIKLYPFEVVQDYTLYLRVAFFPLATITTIDEPFFNRWHRYIEAGAKGELMLMKDVDWSNPKLGAAYVAYCEQGIGAAMAKVAQDLIYEKNKKRSGGYL